MLFHILAFSLASAIGQVITSYQLITVSAFCPKSQSIRELVISVLDKDLPCPLCVRVGPWAMQDTTYLMNLMVKIYWPKNLT